MNECIKGQSSYITVSIIGTAGRDQESKSLLTKDMFDKMIQRTIRELEIIGSKKSIHLVSGGAAWCDHIAVRLFNSGLYASLTLHLPSELRKSGFSEASANRYHQYFSRKVDIDSISELHSVIDNGARVITHQGFYSRNKYVAKSQYIIAFTKAIGNTPCKGGTLNTWNNSKGKRTHVSLKELFKD